MPKQPSPFSGIKLSQEVIPDASAVDQKLFSPPPRTVSPSPGQSPISQEVGKQVKKETSQETSLPGRREIGPVLDLNETSYRKDSFLFTDSEFEALEDLKLALRRRHGLPATKNDIARAALHHIVEDYHRNGDRSIVVSRLRRKLAK